METEEIKDEQIAGVIKPQDETQLQSENPFNEDGINTQGMQQKSRDDILNEMVLKEMNEVEAKHALICFFETGQISTFMLKNREKIESKLASGVSVLELEEIRNAQGFTNGKIFIQRDKLVFAILRDKSSIMQADKRIVLAGR